MAYLRTTRSNFSRHKRHSLLLVSFTQSSLSSDMGVGRQLGCIPDSDPIDRLDLADRPIDTLVVFIELRAGDEFMGSPCPA